MANKNGKMSLEKLARMLERGFEKTATKDEMDRKFDHVDRQFIDVEGHLDGIERRLDSHELILKSMQNAFEEIAREFRTNSFDLEQRVLRLEKRAGLRK